MFKSYHKNIQFLMATCERFWSTVDKKGPDECWMWTGSLTYPSNSGQRYGQFSISCEGRHTSIVAHKISWMLANGEIPEGQIVRHTCDVPGCVNPAHIRIGTHNDNVQDRRKRWRTEQGTDHYKAILTEEQVLEIFDDKTSGHTALGKKYGTDAANIQRIRQAKVWKSVLHKHGRINDPRGAPPASVLQQQEPST